MISVLNDKNLYDIDTGDFNSTIKNNTNQSGLAYLMQYSQLENSNQKAKDFKTMRAVSKKSFSSSNLKTALSNQSSPRNLVKNQLELIDSIQFDIFALNEIQNENTAIIIASEILNRYEYVQQGFIHFEMLSSFIKKVSSSYDRKKVIYHNDLHAADVLQTLNTMISRGNLKDKML